MAVPTTIAPHDLEIRLRDLSRPWRWEAIFADERPVEIEVGTGNGTFLVNAALRSPERAFLGIEVAWKFFSKAVRRAAREGATNVRMVYADAPYVLRHCIPPASVAAYHFYSASGCEELSSINVSRHVALPLIWLWTFSKPWFGRALLPRRQTH